MQNRKGKSKSEIQKDEVLQAVVVTDTFTKNFYPASAPYCLLPLVNKSLLDYTLEHLHSAGMEEIIVFCSSHVNQIKELVKRKEPFLWGTTLTLIVTDGCHSFGDVMRDLDGKAVIRSDFVLVTGDVISNVNLLSVLKKFKKINSMDSGAVALLLYKKRGQSKNNKENLVVAYDCDSKKLLMHQVPLENSKKINLPMENILLHSRLEVCSHLGSSGIMICSPAVPPLFSDNFDFQTQEHFIKGVLINEEILDCRLFCHIIDDSEYGISVKDWPSYQIASRDVVHRWVHPFVPSYKYRRNNIYLADNVMLGKGSSLKQQVVIGEGSSIGDNTQVSHCIIGKNCHIGSNVKLENSYLFDNVKIDNNCYISLSVLSNNTGVGENSKLLNGCLLGAGVLIGTKTSLSSVKLASSDVDEVDDGNDSDEEEVPKFRCESAAEGDSEESDSDMDEDDVDSANGPDSAPLDDTGLFYSEVVDSLLRGFEEKLVCDNLTLEINSSRYAYNVTVKEVNFYMVKAILVVGNTENMDNKQLASHMLSKLSYFLPLFKNYIKNEAAEEDCLGAFEEFAEENESFCSVLGKLLHILYDKDILSEEMVTKWFSNLEANLLKKSVEPFVKWLLEADEESEESD